MLLEYWALNAPYFLRLKLKIERVLGVRNLGAHLIKPVNKDVFSMAYKLIRVRTKLLFNKRFFAFYIKSLYIEDLISLAKNMIRYNVKYI